MHQPLIMQATTDRRCPICGSDLSDAVLMPSPAWGNLPDGAISAQAHSQRLGADGYAGSWRGMSVLVP